MRVGATDYREIVASLLYPGSQTSLASLQIAVLALERVLYMDPKRRQNTLLRIDGGFGSDDNLAWVLGRHYQFWKRLCVGQDCPFSHRKISRKVGE